MGESTKGACTCLPAKTRIFYFQHVTQAQDALDRAKGLPTLEEVATIVRKRIEPGTAKMRNVDVLVNMWRLSVQKSTRVHVFVFDYDRINPKTGNVLKLKKDQKYQP
jgi:hypothetical protein